MTLAFFIDHWRRRCKCLGRFGAVGDDARHESVSPLRECFDELGLIGGIVKDFPEAIYCFVETEVEVNERTSWPKSFDEFFPRDHLTRPFQQRGQDLERFFLDDGSLAIAPKLARPEVKFELAKANDVLRFGRILHGWPPGGEVVHKV